MAHFLETDIPLLWHVMDELQGKSGCIQETQDSKDQCSINTDSLLLIETVFDWAFRSALRHFKKESYNR